jgi:hypothetical protein
MNTQGLIDTARALLADPHETKRVIETIIACLEES